ncbi:MAG: VWA domain-containing protein [Pirellulaceae bacterium]
MSFLDLLSCALGAVLLLLLVVMTQSQRKVSAFRVQIDGMEKQMSDARAAVAVAIEQASEHKDARESLERAQSALIGFQGEFQGVMFVVDSSGSMRGERFADCQALLKQWLTYLPFQDFNVIDFDDRPKPWRPDVLVDATESARKAACSFVDDCSPKGDTDTLGALQTAFSMPGVDTIILISDGAPDQSMAEIHEWLSTANEDGEVTINCVGMGDYFQEDYGPFLQKIANDHGGMFLGR